MTRLDNLKGLLSVRSINTLKRIGYMYLEEVSCEELEKWFLGRKTKKEILDFIKTWNSITDAEKIVKMKKADIKYDVKMYKVHEGEYISDNGNWTVTRNRIYFNYKDTSYLIGNIEDVPHAVQEVYNKLKK